MDEDQNTFFHLPVDKDSVEYTDKQIVKAISTVEPGTIRYVKSGANDETRLIYDELSAISEEVMKCRDAAILRLA